MISLSNFLHNSDWLLTVVVVLAIVLGLVGIFSFAPTESRMMEKQFFWVAVGLFAFFAFTLIDYRLFRNHGGFLVILYLAVVAFLIVLLFFGPITRGVVSWFRVLGAGIQPVEPMKLVLVLVLAKYFSRRHVEIARIRHLFISAAYTVLPMSLVFLQPDLGSSLIVGVVWVVMVIAAGIRLRHLAVFALAVIMLGLLSWNLFLAPYQKDRVLSFFDPYRDPQGTGYHAIQAMIAVGSGQIIGKGIGYGSQSHLNFLPEAETDFIFAAFTEETGVIGAAILIGLFGIIFWRMIAIGTQAKDNFSKLYAIGFTAFVFTAFGIHVAINLGLMPVTGIGLPFVSYGGSSLITVLSGLGILQSIRINSQAEIE